MTGKAMFSGMLATVWRWAGLVPGLLRHDPLFRYAAIAAVLALFFLAARVMQDFAGKGAIPPPESDGAEQDAGQADDRSALDKKPPRPGSAKTAPATGDASPPVITPGRSLEHLEVEPAPPDIFGTLPQREKP